METKKTIFQKLLEVKKDVPYLKKNKQGHKYNYADPESVLGTINPLLNKVGLFLKTEILDSKITPTEITDKNGVHMENLYLLKLKYTWIDVESGETSEVLWESSGCNGEEKGLGSALTYSERYFMLKTFNIPTGEDDPDARQSDDRKQVVDTKREEAKARLLVKAVELGAELGLETEFIEKTLGRTFPWAKLSTGQINGIKLKLEETVAKSTEPVIKV